MGGKQTPGKEGTRPASPRASVICGVLVGLAVIAVYFIGAGRAYSYDASVTVHRFVATASLLDPLRKQLTYNNHVLFSLIDHLVYSATGSRREVVLRIVPIVASGVAVGLVAWAAAKRLGKAAGVAAGAVLATNPILIADAREVRGYALLLLASVASTLLLVDLRGSGTGRAKVVAYELTLAAGIATHLYGVLMLPIHAAIVGRREVRRWVPRWLVAGVLGLLAYVGVAEVMLHAHRGRAFHIGFPYRLSRSLLGDDPIACIALAIPLAVGGFWLLFRPWARRAAVVTVALVFAIWLVAPHDLYPRFFIWLVPAVAYTAAIGVSRRRVLVLAVVAFVAVEAIRLGPNYARSNIANRGAGQVAARAAGAGRSSCAFRHSARPMEAYAPYVRVIDRTQRPPACDLIFLLAPGEALPRAWGAAFPYRRVLNAANPGVVYSRRSL